MMLELTGKDILALTNESKRKAVLADWQNWGIWHKAPEIGLSVYRLDLPDGSFFTASWYEGDDFFPGGGTHNVNRPRFNLCDKGRQVESREQGREPADGQAQGAAEGAAARCVTAKSRK